MQLQLTLQFILATSASAWYATDRMHAWPRNSKGIAVVTYCYESQSAHDELALRVDRAWEVWHSAIGDPGEDTGHALTFEQHRSETGRPWCYYTDNIWNEEIDEGTLVIKLDDGDLNGDDTTVGYTRWQGWMQSDRHHMTVGGASTDWVFGTSAGQLCKDTLTEYLSTCAGSCLWPLA
jgi:hypothetical protein